MKILSKKQIIFLHEHLINATGGTEGIKDEGMLESAMNAFSNFWWGRSFSNDLPKSC